MSRQGTLQHRPPAGPLLAALFACLLLMPIHAAAAEQVGRVLVATGSVTAEQEDASARALGRRDPIYAGDRIRTSPRGRVQIRFEDGAMVDLDPSSTFEVEEYASEDEDGGGSAIMSFLTGAMRTITGAIGGNRGDQYRMNTTVATIGIRGTAYALEYCDAACAEDGGSEGLYGRVDDGEVEVDAPGGTDVFTKGQYFFVADGGAPGRIVVPPDGILEGDGETGAGGDDDRIEDVRIRPLGTSDEDGVDLGGNDTDLLDPDFESGENTDLGSLRPGTSVSGGFGGAYLGSSGFAAYEAPGGGDVRIDDQGRIVGAEFEGIGFVDASDLGHTGGFTELFDSVENRPFNVSWGSWSTNSPQVGDGDIDGFLYAFTDTENVTTPTELGSLEGTLPFGAEGGPTALGSAGNEWQINGLSLGVDFGQSAITQANIDLSSEGVLGFEVFNISVGAGFAEGGIAQIDPDGTFFVGDMAGGSTNDAPFEGDLQGLFLGSDAENVLVAFEVREVNGERRIVGTQVMSPVF